MSPQTFLSIAAVVFAVTLAGAALLADRRSFVRWSFAVGMLLLGLEEAFRALSAEALLISDLVYWQQFLLLTAAFVPGAWLLFSLSFSRANYREFLAKWKWPLAFALIVPLTLTTLFSDALFVAESSLIEPPLRYLQLDWAGFAFFVIMLLTSVVILMNLEMTLRASVGSIRWRIKFILLGIGSLFAVRIYTSSQTLLFALVDLELQPLNAAVLLTATVFLAVSFGRAQLAKYDFYISPAFLYNSFTIVVVGLYLILVGVMAKARVFFGGNYGLAAMAFLVFVAVVALAVFLLSDQLQQELRRFLYRNFRKPRYDYRKEWMTFTQRTSSIRDVGQLCGVMSNMISGIFGVPSVTLWLADESEETLHLGGSTAFSVGDGTKFKAFDKSAKALLSAIQGQAMPVDFDRARLEWAETLKEANPDYFREARICYCAPLVAGSKLMGLVTLGRRLSDDPFSIEDVDLLKTIADQTAAALHNLRLSEDLLRAKEMEAFQTLSTFFVHDLKNLASTLSLTMQNLKTHFDNEEFRNDAFQTISQSVEQIDTLCARLSSVNKEPVLRLSQVNLNRLVETALDGLNGSLKIPVLTNLHPIPEIRMDPDQIQKVLVNLVLNANDAVEEKGRIEVRTEKENGWVVLSVIDDGCGMSKDFISHSLFRPFSSTKKRGLGIGLFQSKKLVEAQQGRLEVQSEEGKGSTFRILLPLQSNS